MDRYGGPKPIIQLPRALRARHAAIFPLKNKKPYVFCNANDGNAVRGALKAQRLQAAKVFYAMRGTSTETKLITLAPLPSLATKVIV